MSSDNQTAPDALTFADLGLSPKVLAAVTDAGYTIPTPIQAGSIPHALLGKDILGIAQTGTGKTAAFVLPMITRLEKGRARARMPRTLILEPTRELAAQVEENFIRYGKNHKLNIALLIGGVSFDEQEKKLERGADVLIATPGRLLDHQGRGKLLLTGVEILVIDEADRMLDMGFLDDIVTVTKQCPPERQTLLFSATYPEGIEKLAKQFMRSPEQITVADSTEKSLIEQRFYEVTRPTRFEVVAKLLNHFRPVSTLAFCNTKQQCKDLVTTLQQQGFSALALYGELEQRERDQVLAQFANRSASVLVATDVASRGIDIKELSAVINVDITPDPEVHVHRIGRTGRAGETGLAFSLAAMYEMGAVGKIEQYQKQPSTWHKLDELTPTGKGPLLPPMVTLQILGGRKEKIRPGDVLGALTADAGFSREQIGKIVVTEFTTFVAVQRDIAREAMQKLNAGKVKGKSVRVRAL
ncbi:MAG: ATP-dependent RNA helicase DbpA [Rhodoferax sp.]|nr:ATP-dependent RNA helicase DbpA [Rhodoferax sp.]MDP3865578.1 ATP-dependent RNA helicase DbpA [Rhodoferax sp.]